MGDYFFVVLPRREWVNVCRFGSFLLKMSISAVTTARMRVFVLKALACQISNE
jgi:hypothetical protein